MQHLKLSVVPDSTGMVGFNPGPKTHDGLYFEKQSDEEGNKTLDLMMRMANRLIGEGMRTTVSDLEKDWHEDMIWWGPGGIGASYTYDGYLKGHTGPFEENLEFVEFSGHVLENSEGNYGGWFGWPNLKMRPKGNYMGLTQNTDLIGEMRVVDLYRRDKNKKSYAKAVGIFTSTKKNGKWGLQLRIMIPASGNVTLAGANIK